MSKSSGVAIQATVHLYERPDDPSPPRLFDVAVETHRSAVFESHPLEDLLLATCLAIRQLYNLSGANGQHLARLLIALPGKLRPQATAAPLGPLVMPYEDLEEEKALEIVGPKLLPYPGSPAPKSFTSTLAIEGSGRFTYFMKPTGFSMWSGPPLLSVVSSVIAIAQDAANRRGEEFTGALNVALVASAQAFLGREISSGNQRELARLICSEVAKGCGWAPDTGL